MLPVSAHDPRNRGLSGALAQRLSPHSRGRRRLLNDHRSHPDALWRKYRRSRDTATEQALVLFYQDWATSRVFEIVGHERISPVIDIEDLCSLALVELQRQIGKWEPRRANFMTFARHRIDGAIRDAVRRERGTRRVRPVRVLSGLHANQSDSRTADNNEACDARDCCNWALRRLNDAERLVMRLLYWEGLTAPEVAARVGRCVSTVHEMRRRAFAKMRKLEEK